MPRLLKSLKLNETGSTAIEYGLIAALIVIASIGAFDAVSNENTGLWGSVKSAVVDSTSKSRDGV